MPTNTSNSMIASCVNVSKEYQRAAGVVTALKDVTYKFHRGQLTVVGGPSGSGKSTLLGMLCGALTRSGWPSSKIDPTRTANSA